MIEPLDSLSVRSSPAPWRRPAAGVRSEGRGQADSNASAGQQQQRRPCQLASREGRGGARLGEDGVVRVLVGVVLHHGDGEPDQLRVLAPLHLHLAARSNPCRQSCRRDGGWGDGSEGGQGRRCGQAEGSAGGRVGWGRT